MAIDNHPHEDSHSHEHEKHTHEEPYVLDKDSSVEDMAITDDHSHGGHSHETGGNVLVDAWGIFTDPAHFIAEIGFSLVIDFFLIFLGYQLFVKKVVIPRLRKQIHKELDAELHVEHTEDGGHIHKEH